MTIFFFSLLTLWVIFIAWDILKPRSNVIDAFDYGWKFNAIVSGAFLLTIFTLVAMIRFIAVHIRLSIN